MRDVLRNLLRPGERLAARVFTAGAWAFALRIAMRVLILVRTVILARLLVPEDFGLMAIATLAILLLDRVTKPGFDSALVQRKGDIRGYMDTAWTVQLARAALMALILVVAAPSIAAFFGAPEAEQIIRVLSIAVLARGLASIGVVEFWRELRFDRYFWLEMSDKIADVLVSIGAAIVLRNVWALVLGVMAGAIVKTITSYVLHPYRPRIHFGRSESAELFGFGKWMWASNILTYTVTSLDDILVGRMLGVTQLGWYRMAYNFSQAVVTEFAIITSQVAFPTYSTLQTQRERLSAAYLGTLHFVAFLAFPVAIGTLLLATDLTVGLLGPGWAPMIPALRLLCIAGLARALAVTANPLFQGVGKPVIPAGFAAAEVTLLVLFLVPAINELGTEGAAGVVAASSVIVGAVALVMALGFVRAHLREIIQALGYPAFNTGVMTVAVVGAASLFPNRPSAMSFVVLVLVGMVAYFASVGLTVRFGRYQAPTALLSRLRGANAEAPSELADDPDQ